MAALLALSALATFSPAFHAWCVLDRDALATGEVWRLWTGHLAHFSASHLVVDALVFALLVGALRRAGECALGRVLFLGGAALSVSLLVCDSSLARYGGLSGLNALLLGRLVLRWLQAGGRQRVLGLALLVVAVGKFALDSIGLGGPSVEFDSVAVVPSHLSHWLGLFWGLGWRKGDTLVPRGLHPVSPLDRGQECPLYGSGEEHFLRCAAEQPAARG